MQKIKLNYSIKLAPSFGIKSKGGKIIRQKVQNGLLYYLEPNNPNQDRNNLAKRYK